eukprot:13323128-Alexandrium_andersonii.AAC.1
MGQRRGRWSTSTACIICERSHSMGVHHCAARKCSMQPLCIHTCNAPTCAHNDNSAQRAAVPHQNNMTSN